MLLFPVLLLATGCNPFRQTTITQDTQRAAVQASPITTDKVKEAVPSTSKAGATLEFRVIEAPQVTASGDVPITWRPTGLTGAQVALATADYQTSGTQKYAFVRLEFNSQGKALLAKITQENIGKQIGIFVDGEMVSAPVVQTSITDGVAIITGSFTPEQAQDLAARLNTIPYSQAKQIAE